MISANTQRYYAWIKKNPERAKAIRKKWCDANRDKVRAQRQRAYYKDPEKARARQRSYRKNNRDKVNAYCREYHQRDYVKTAVAVRARRRKYGISEEARVELLRAQNYACGICQSPDPKDKRGWHTDHCHATGKVRGLLCSKCNLMLGHALDSPDILRSAISYLEKSHG